MSNTEQMVSVPREWVENYAGLLEERCAYEASERVQAHLAQPAAQHHGEPVAWQDPDNDSRMCTAEHKAYALSKGGAPAAALASLTRPLYTHADPAEVERLRNEARSMGDQINKLSRLLTAATKPPFQCCYCRWGVAVKDGCKCEVCGRASSDPIYQPLGPVAELESLRAQLAELRSALEGMLEYFPEGHSDGECFSVEKAKAVLSAITEPSAPVNQCDGCQAGIPLVSGAHRMGTTAGYSDTMSCQASKYEPGAEPWSASHDAV